MNLREGNLTAYEAFRYATVAADHTPRTAARSWRDHRRNWYRRIRRDPASSCMAMALWLVYRNPDGGAR